MLNGRGRHVRPAAPRAGRVHEQTGDTMKKLKLDLDTMRVESFSTGASGGKGTVRANSGVSSDCSVYPPHTCQGNTCWDSCGGSCDALCGYNPTQAYWNTICV
jgi:hypothetical protein